MKAAYPLYQHSVWLRMSYEAQIILDEETETRVKHLFFDFFPRLLAQSHKKSSIESLLAGEPRVLSFCIKMSLKTNRYW